MSDIFLRKAQEIMADLPREDLLSLLLFEIAPKDDAKGDMDKMVEGLSDKGKEFFLSRMMIMLSKTIKKEAVNE